MTIIFRTFYGSNMKGKTYMLGDQTPKKAEKKKTAWKSLSSEWLSELRFREPKFHQQRGHTETGPWCQVTQVSSERQKKREIEFVIPELAVQRVIHYTTDAPISSTKIFFSLHVYHSFKPLQTEMTLLAMFIMHWLEVSIFVSHTNITVH